MATVSRFAKRCYNGKPDFSGNFQQIGGFIGTGDQSNYLKFVAIDHFAGELELVLEENDVVASSSYIQADDLFDVPAGSQILLRLEIDINAGTATPTAIYETGAGNTVVTGAAVDLAGTSVLEAIQGNASVNGQSTGLAVGLYSSNTGQSPANTFSAVFDNVEISAV